jgi:hypothetical protein
MTDWIDFGNSFDFSYVNIPDVADESDPPDLSAQERALFGVTYQELHQQLSENEETTITDILVEARIEVAEEWQDTWINQKLAEHKLTERYALFQRMIEIGKWQEEQPEWKAWEDSVWGARQRYIAEQETQTFRGQGLNKPGTLIELEDGRQFLIGHVNIYRGGCDHCPEFEQDAVVKRYAVIWTPEMTP